MAWQSDLTVTEIGSPQRIAPYSVAIEAELTHEDEELASGRLVMLHDPAGNEAWQGTFRVVSLVRADVDLEMVADPLLPEVAWSWLTDSLASHSADHLALAGTVTASYGRTFGDMPEEGDRGDVEIRSSWTPTDLSAGRFTEHLTAWQDLLRHLAGEPPTPEGVVRFPSAP